MSCVFGLELARVFLVILVGILLAIFLFATNIALKILILDVLVIFGLLLGRALVPSIGVLGE